MQRNIFLGTFGVLLAAVAMVGGFHLSFWLFYAAHHAEDVSGLIVIAVLIASIVLSILRRFRPLVIGMVGGCVIGLLVLGVSLWGA